MPRHINASSADAACIGAAMTVIALAIRPARSFGAWLHRNAGALGIACFVGAAFLLGNALGGMQTPAKAPSAPATRS